MPKRRPTSRCPPATESGITPAVKRVRGWAPARLDTRLITPPTLPPGAIPNSAADGPLGTSTRSAASSGARQYCVSPNMPLRAKSPLGTAKPRMVMSSLMFERALAMRTEGSIAITSATERACPFSIACAV